MADKEKEKRDLESGDNPAERETTSAPRKGKKEGEEKRDLESGDNPEERESTTG
ncbi:MAG: hypothetical protein ACOC1D_01285 [Prolixibacteraceae bacterium]